LRLRKQMGVVVFSESSVVATIRGLVVFRVTGIRMLQLSLSVSEGREGSDRAPLVTCFVALEELGLELSSVEAGALVVSAEGVDSAVLCEAFAQPEIRAKVGFIYLTDCRSDESAYEHIATMPLVRELSLWGGTFAVPELFDRRTLPQLESLMLSGSALPGDLAAALVRHPSAGR
jgi:hypothetical protein